MPAVDEPGQTHHSRQIIADPAFWMGTAVYVSSTLAVLVAEWLRSDRHFVYPLDDVYIHMAVARNFALHGVWGVTPYEFSSSTSSPVYVLLLAAIFKLVGVQAGVALALSALSGLGVVWAAADMLQPLRSTAYRTFALTSAVLLTPLFVLGSLGMEHALHLLLALIFLRELQQDKAPLWRLAAVTALMCGTRYEGILMAGVATLVLLGQRKWGKAAAVAVSAWVPVGIYAVFSIAHGGYWLPNSVAIKGVRVSGGGVKDRLLGLGASLHDKVVLAPHLAPLLIALAIMAVVLYRRERKLSELAAILAGSGIMHMVTADVGWVFRYESYLVGAGLIVVALSWAHLRQASTPASLAAGGLLGLSVLVLVLRAVLAAQGLPQFSQGIYLQQFQTARFLKSFYPDGSVAANDVGLINFQSNLHCFDMAGLASAAVFEAKRGNTYKTAFVEQQASARHIQVAVVYDSWFSNHASSENPALAKLGGPPLPASWIRAGRWSVPEKHQLGDRTISFYAINAEQAAVLKNRLAEFEPSLPRQVTVTP